MDPIFLLTFRFCVNFVSNTLTPRLAEKYLNEAAAMSDLVPNKMSIIKPLLHWVGDNIATLRERNLLSNLEKPALIILVKSGLLCLHVNDVWRMCLSWAMRKCGITQQSNRWSDQERGGLRQELDGVVQHIKLQQIDRTEKVVLMLHNKLIICPK